MRTTRIILAIDPKILRQMLKGLIERQPDFEVVGEVNNPVDMLLAVGRTQANVVVHAWPESERMPEICTHLLSEYPDLLIIGICPGSEKVFTCRQTIEVTPAATSSIDDMISVMRVQADDDEAPVSCTPQEVVSER